ncbi:hypothetical protein [Phnomibacter ginsenosidimutans]|uniref:hypothetical protein n=1 Tax=Phnomibacter ginsenosidimutans TaxID=2676868 RepID=UPI001FEB2D63|nr:hypothetical protein [Phnomibacter ginsenosidimutans]
MYIHWNDTVNLLSKLTLRRLWNAGKVWSSYQLSKWLRKPIQWGLPVSISFEPTTSCNLRCPECPSGLREFSRPTGMLQQDFFAKPSTILPPICCTSFSIFKVSRTSIRSF